MKPAQCCIKFFGPNKEMWWLTCNDKTCTSGRCTSFKTPDDGRFTPETCRVTLKKWNLHSVASSFSGLIRRYDDLPATITHVPVAAVLVLNTPDDGRLRPKHVEWLCRNKTCIVLHQVGVSFDWVSTWSTQITSDLFLIWNFRSVVNVVFFGKSGHTCLIWTREEKDSWCVIEAAVEDSLFDSRKCQRSFFFLRNCILVIEPNLPHIERKMAALSPSARQ